MRIGIIGSGAMGSLFAARLSTATDVVMVGHWAAQLTAVQADGLTLQTPDGRSRHYHIQATDDPTAVAPVDIALILVKSWQTTRAAREADVLLLPNGVAVTLQNGLGNRETVAATLGAARVTLGTTTQGATMVAPGTVRHAGRGPTHLAVTDETAAAVTQLSALLNDAGIDTHLSTDVAGLLWGKLAVNAAINPLTALLRVRNGFLADNEAARQMMRRAADEVAAVAKAQAIPLPFSDAAQQALTVARATATNRSSMLQDVLRGAPTEIEAICGAVVRIGQSHHVPTPVNETLLQLVQETVANGRQWQLDDLAAVVLKSD